jgi:broad specificity phosphatase PhoE
VDLRPTLIYLLRHGEVVLAETRRFIGHLDVPLSPRGEAQCAAQARRLAAARIDTLYSSDLERARRSGEIIGAPHGLRPQPLPALREMAMGRWEGLTADEIEAREPAAFRDWMARVGEFPFPEGESVPDLLARAGAAFDEIVARAHAHTVAIVAHGGTNRALLCRALGLPPSRLLTLGQDYAALSVLERTAGGWTLRCLNEAPPR